MQNGRCERSVRCLADTEVSSVKSEVCDY